MRKRIVVVADKMQKGYRYALSAPMGRQFDPEFKPELTPREMLRLGIFCGKYMTDTRKEFPASWFIGAKLARKHRDCSLNFLVSTRVSRSRSGATTAGSRRRMPDEDRRQIKRWKAMRRHIRQIERNCAPGDIFCRPRQRQALLHWAYDSRKF